MDSANSTGCQQNRSQLEDKNDDVETHSHSHPEEDTQLEKKQKKLKQSSRKKRKDIQAEEESLIEFKTQKQRYKSSTKEGERELVSNYNSFFAAEAVDNLVDLTLE